MKIREAKMSDINRNIKWVQWENEEDWDLERHVVGQHWYDRNPPAYFNPNSGQVGWWHGKCHNCNEFGHHSKICPQPQREPRCVYCGASGHTRRDCHRRQQMQHILETERKDAERAARKKAIEEARNAGHSDDEQSEWNDDVSRQSYPNDSTNDDAERDERWSDISNFLRSRRSAIRAEPNQAVDNEKSETTTSTEDEEEDEERKVPNLVDYILNDPQFNEPEAAKDALAPVGQTASMENSGADAAPKQELDKAAVEPTNEEAGASGTSSNAEVMREMLNSIQALVAAMAKLQHK